MSAGSSGLENLKSLWSLRDEVDHEEGLLAYSRYRKTLSRFADHYGFKLCDVASAFVALSPNNDYHGNLRSLASVLAGYRDGLHPEEITVSTYKACRNRALSYLSGEANFIATVKGPKIRAFRDNILRPNSSKEVTVDGHIVGAWYAEPFTMKQAAAKLRGKRHYQEIAEGVRYLAARVGHAPCQTQAVLWHTRKRVLRVKYEAQLNLFNLKGDAWRSECSPQDFPPYPNRREDTSDISPTVSNPTKEMSNGSFPYH